MTSFAPEHRVWCAMRSADRGEDQAHESSDILATVMVTPDDDCDETNTIACQPRQKSARVSLDGLRCLTANAASDLTCARQIAGRPDDELMATRPDS